MGKKYIPVEFNTYQYRVYLTDLIKIYKIAKKTHLQAPSYCRSMTRKESLETIPDALPYFQLHEPEM